MPKLICSTSLDGALSALCSLCKENEANYERTVVFCEDRLTLLCERAILRVLDGTILTEVKTFARTLAEKNVLSKQGSVVLIETLIEENRERLLCFGPNSAQAVYETIAQLSASRVDAAFLRESAAEAEGALKNKLLDLALLVEAYGARLQEKNMLDENSYLSLLPRELSKEEYREKHIVFFGFSSFTKQAQEGVVAALNTAKSTTGIFLSGKGKVYTNEAAHIFRNLCGADDLQIIRREDFISEEERLIKGALFSQEIFLTSPYQSERIRMFTAADEEEEFSIAAALIKKTVAQGGRYREIAVLVPDHGCLPILEKVFHAYRIPFYADRKRSFSEHPFCRMILAVLSAVADSALPEEIDEIASNVYFGCGGEYRNYLRKFGSWRGAVRKEIKEGDAARGFNRSALCSCREKTLSLLALFPKKERAVKFAEAIQNAFTLLNGEEITQSLKDSFFGAEREFLELSPLSRILEEIVFVEGERLLGVREFYKALKSGLEALEIGMIPQSADAVFVGDATDCKFERVKVLFATGLSDTLPRTMEDTALITDGELEKLRTLKVEIEPAVYQVNARARESLALNLCAFEENLYLSCSLKRGGKDSEPGEVILGAKRLFQTETIPDLFPYDCCEKEPAALKLLSLKDEFERGRIDGTKRYTALYAAVEHEFSAEDLERLLSGGVKRNVKNSDQSEITPTQLETYFECPYAGFAKRVLKLKEREEQGVLDTDTGTFVHQVLEACGKRFNFFRNERECREFARMTGEEIIKGARFSLLGDTNAGKYAAERLLKEGEEVAAACYLQLTLSRFTVQKTEGKIRLHELSLTGRCDRVDASDEYIRVIDYKTGQIDDTALSYYTGRKLQLQLYLRAVSREKRAAGAFYFPAQDDFSKPGEAKFRMSGFYCAEPEVVKRMDITLQEGDKSAFFEGRLDGKFTDKGMSEEDFDAFLDYSVLLSQRAEREIREGNIVPSPYEGACEFCKLKSLCGFTDQPRRERTIKCSQISRLTRLEKREK